MIKLLLIAVVPFMTEHRNVTPKTEVSTNFYGSVTGIVDNAYIQAHGGGGGGVDTNAVRDIILDEITPATNNLYTTLNGSIDVKRDKTDLAVYDVVRTENTDWTLTTNVVDRLATTNDVNAAMTNRYTKSETDAKLAGKLDSRAAERGSISWNVNQDDTANLIVSAISADFDGQIFVAGDSTFNGRVSCTYGWEGFESNGEILPVYLDSLEWRTTGNRTLSDYGITDATPLSMISETDPTFSNAVLAVGLNIDTNSVAVLNEIAATFGGFPIEGTATTVGGLLAALAAAIAWLKKNKVGSFASVGGASATVENGVAKLSDFFTNSNSLLTSRVNTLIDAKVGNVNAVLAAALDGTEVA